MDPPTASEEESNTTKIRPPNQHRRTGLDPEDSTEEKAAEEELEREHAEQEAAAKAKEEADAEARRRAQERERQEAAAKAKSEAEAETRRREHEEQMKGLNSLADELKEDTAPFSKSTSKKTSSTESSKSKKSAAKKKRNTKVKAKRDAPRTTQNVTDEDSFSSVDMGMNSDEDEESEDYIGDVDMNQVHSTNRAPGELYKKMRVDDNQGNNGSSGNNSSV